MTVRRSLFGSCVALALLAASAAHAVVFSGEVRAQGAQALFCPPSDSAPVVLRYFVPDGAAVKAGDVVLRIDAGEAAAQIRQSAEKADEARTKLAKEAADLRLKRVDAELLLIDAQAALDTARVDAAIPRALVSALDYDRYHAELDRATHDAALKQAEVDAANAAIERREADGRIEIEKLLAQKVFNEAKVAGAEVRAERDGTVVHGFNRFFGSRFDEGASAFPGQELGTIVGSQTPSVRAWVLEPDRPGLAAGQSLRLSFDALPGRSVAARIAAISGASEEHVEWGAGRYYVVDIDLGDTGLSLKPGMSVRIESEATTPFADAAGGAHKAARASGEVYARTTAAITFPQIEDVWQLTVTQMAADGQVVKKGEPIVSFDGGEIQKQLVAKRSELEEKKRTMEKLRLELADKARAEAVTVAEAKAEATKAARKASQPEAYVPGVEYRKLVIARRKAEQREAKSIERERVAGDERRAEQQAADADVARLSADVARYEDALAKLNMVAPRDGTFLHATAPWNGEKVDVGKQVWRGIAVGEIPDTTTLAVRASLPERDLARVHAGDKVRIVLDGGSGQTLPGHVEDIGIGVHSKSRVEPVPVVDLHVALDGAGVTLKPGQPVHVEIVGDERRGASS